MTAIIDPATYELITTSLLAIGVLIGGLGTLLALPWTDDEIASVDQSFRRFLTWSLHLDARRNQNGTPKLVLLPYLPLVSRASNLGISLSHRLLRL